MTSQPMQKIQLAGLLSEEERILDLLKKEGLLEIRQISRKREIPPEENNDSQIASARYAISFIERFSKVKKSFWDSLIPPKFDLKKTELKKVSQNFEVDKILEEIRELDSELQNNHTLKTSLSQNYAALLPYKELDIPLDRIYTNTVSILTGSIRLKDHRQFEINLRAQTPYLETEIVSFSKGEAHLVIFFLTSEEEKVKKFLSGSGFVQSKLPSSHRPPAEEIKNIKTELEYAQKSENEFIQTATTLNKYKYDLMLLHDHLLERQQNYQAKNKSAATRYTFIIEGWIRSRDLVKLISRLPKAIEIFEIEAEKDEKIPSAIENHPLLSPYELIVSLFGLPSREELEPTAMLAPFFLLFFGICLSDAGYGILLVLLSLWLLKNLKLPVARLPLLLLHGGLITIPIGIISGSYFSLSPKELPFGLSMLKHLQLIDPIKNPVLMLVISFCLGIIQIIFGMILDGIKKIKNGNVPGVFLDNLPWIIFLLSLASLFVVQSYNRHLAVLMAAVLIMTQGRSEKNIFQKLIKGVLSLYSTSSYLGDTLSYSRLLALMMTTSIIGMVINILAGMVSSVPLVGFLLMAVVLAVGHIFNLVISVLGAFIHSMRLQMVEFFGKFYSNGGQEFRPFRYNTKYVNIIE